MKPLHDLTREDFAAHVSYHPDTGDFRYVRKSNRATIGQIAGTTISTGYRILNLLGHRAKAHRVAVLLMTGAWPLGEVDHINGNRSDNRWCNLRDGTKAENQQNVWQPRADNRLGFRGVHKLGGRSKRFIARTYIGGKRVAIGHYDTAEEAGEAYRKYKLDLFRQKGRPHAG